MGKTYYSPPFTDRNSRQTTARRQAAAWSRETRRPLITALSGRRGLAFEKSRDHGGLALGGFCCPRSKRTTSQRHVRARKLGSFCVGGSRHASRPSVQHQSCGPLTTSSAPGDGRRAGGAGPGPEARYGSPCMAPATARSSRVSARRCLGHATENFMLGRPGHRIHSPEIDSHGKRKRADLDVSGSFGRTEARRTGAAPAGTGPEMSRRRRLADAGSAPPRYARSRRRTQALTATPTTDIAAIKAGDFRCPRRAQSAHGTVGGTEVLGARGFLRWARPCLPVERLVRWREGGRRPGFFGAWGVPSRHGAALAKTARGPCDLGPTYRIRASTVHDPMLGASTRTIRRAPRDLSPGHLSSCDIVGASLVPSRRRSSGGLSALVELTTISKRNASARPARTCENSVRPVGHRTGRQARVPEGQKTLFPDPDVQLEQRAPSPRYQRQYIDSAPSFRTRRGLTPGHVEGGSGTMFDADGQRSQSAHCSWSSKPGGTCKLVHKNHTNAA